MIISADRRVMFFNRFRSEGLRVLLHPGFELRISRFALLDVILHRLLIEPESGASHRVVSATDAWITRGQFPCRFQRDLLPKAREVEDSEGAGRAGTD